MTRKGMTWDDVQACLDFADVVIRSLQNATTPEERNIALEKCRGQIPTLNSNPLLRRRYVVMLNECFSDATIVGSFKVEKVLLSNIDF